MAVIDFKELMVKLLIYLGKFLKKKKKKITVLDFGCGSMNVSRKLNKYSFIKQIVGIDTFYFKFESKKMQYVQSDKFRVYFFNA